MKFTNFITYTGIPLYVVLVLITWFVMYDAKEFVNIPSAAYVLVALFLLVIPVEITLVNRKRQAYGHKDFGLADMLGVRKENEMETKEWQERAYPEISEKYINKLPVDYVIGTYRNKYVSVPVSLKDGVNCYCLGGVGSGKSVTLIGMLLSCLYRDRFSKKNKQPFNFFVVDIKGEIYNTLLKIDGKYRAEDNYPIKVVQPSNRDSYGWDVFYRIRGNVSQTVKIKAVNDICEALIPSDGDQTYFTTNARKALAGIFLHYIEQGWEFIPIIQKISRTGFNELLNEIVQEAEQSDEGIVLDMLKGYLGKDGNESLQDIETTLKSNLGALSFPNIVYMCHTNPKKIDPSILDLGKENIDLAIEQGMLAAYRPVFRLITLQVLRHCEACFHENDNRMTALFYDEAAKIGEIDELDLAMATLRSKKTSIILCFQSIHQFLEIYKKERALTILGLCEMKIFLSGDGDKETLDYISTMAGEYQIKKRSYEKGGVLSLESNLKYSDDFRKIINVESIMNLRERKEAIAFIYGKYYRFRKFEYYKDKYLKKIYEEIAAYNAAHSETKENGGKQDE